MCSSGAQGNHPSRDADGRVAITRGRRRASAADVGEESSILAARVVFISCAMPPSPKASGNFLRLSPQRE